MAYITQGGLPNCGAFAVAYYKWAKSGVYDEPTSHTQVAQIYDTIRFPSGYFHVNLRGLSNPVKIMQSIQPMPVFYYNARTIVECLLGMLKDGHGPDKETIEGWETSAPPKVVASSPPIDANGYLISLCYMISRNEIISETEDKAYPADSGAAKAISDLLFSNGIGAVNPLNVHYTLIKIQNGMYTMLNSWDGEERELPGGFMNGTETVQSGGGGDYLGYLKSGIWIPD
jgi:hypothetical protein